MKLWYLTPQAEKSLTDIASWTLKHFGKRQALAYRDDLIDCINLLASDVPPLARNCNLLMQGQIPVSKDLLYYQLGRHYIVFRHSNTQLEVLEFFHERMDLPNHINHLTQIKK